ncbi:transposase [Xenorhabdus sp. Sc-CR9]|uniref:transposase n=1 Tax=Xenorhabdus sp. Sc-CR9 TaxID=2584468 RepID=UPI003FCE2E83
MNCPASLATLIAVDILGLSHSVAIIPANVTDRKGILTALDPVAAQMIGIQSILADSGYMGQPFADSIKECLDQIVTVQIAKCHMGENISRQPSTITGCRTIDASSGM